MVNSQIKQKTINRLIYCSCTPLNGIVGVFCRKFSVIQVTPIKVAAFASFALFRENTKDHGDQWKSFGSVNIYKRNFTSVNTIKTKRVYKINKQYKKIKSLVFNNTYKYVKKESAIQPLYLSILAFDSSKDSLIPYNIDVSLILNKPPKSIILKYWKKTKISKSFAHWLYAYKEKNSHSSEDARVPKGVFTPKGAMAEFYKISQIPGANTFLYHFKLLINCSVNKLALSKTRLSSLITQVLYNQPIKKEKRGANTDKMSSILGAFIIYKKPENIIKDNNLFVYFVSSSELQQCAATVPSEKQSLSQWDNYMGLDKKKTLLHSLVGFPAPSLSGQVKQVNRQFIRTCMQKNNESEKSFVIVNKIARFGTLAYAKHPSCQLIMILQIRTVQ